MNVRLRSSGEKAGNLERGCQFFIDREYLFLYLCFMDQEPVFVLAQNINTFNSLKGWLYTPPVFFVLFAWVMATIVSVKILDTKPFKWVLFLTVILFLFRLIPMNNSNPPLTQEQITQITTQLANMNKKNEPLPVVATPTGTPSAQLITE